MKHLELSNSIEALSQFLVEDNRLLEEFQENKVLERVPQKEALIEAYTNAYEAFKSDKTTVQTLPHEIKKSLIEAVQALEKVTHKNHALIGRVLWAHEYYLKTLTRLTREKITPKVEGYSALGRYKGRPSSLPALSLNHCT